MSRRHRKRLYRLRNLRQRPNPPRCEAKSGRLHATAAMGTILVPCAISLVAPFLRDDCSCEQLAFYLSCVTATIPAHRLIFVYNAVLRTMRVHPLALQGMGAAVVSIWGMTTFVPGHRAVEIATSLLSIGLSVAVIWIVRRAKKPLNHFATLPMWADCTIIVLIFWTTKLGTLHHFRHHEIPLIAVATIGAIIMHFSIYIWELTVHFSTSNQSDESA
jgi:hypothetical protein